MNELEKSPVRSYMERDIETECYLIKDKIGTEVVYKLPYTNDVWEDGSPVVKMFRRNEEITLQLLPGDEIEGVLYLNGVNLTLDFYFRKMWYRLNNASVLDFADYLQNEDLQEEMLSLCNCEDREQLWDYMCGRQI